MKQNHFKAKIWLWRMVLAFAFMQFTMFVLGADLQEAKMKLLFRIPKSYFQENIKVLDSKEREDEIFGRAYWYSVDNSGNICVSNGKSVVLYSPKGNILKTLTPGGNVSTRWFSMDDDGRLLFDAVIISNGESSTRDNITLWIYDKKWEKDGEFKVPEWCRARHFQKGNIVCNECTGKCGIVYVCKDGKRIAPKCPESDCYKLAFRQDNEIHKNLLAAGEKLDDSFHQYAGYGIDGIKNYISYSKKLDESGNQYANYYKLDNNKKPVTKFVLVKDSEKGKVSEMLELKNDKIYLMKLGMFFASYYVVEM